MLPCQNASCTLTLSPLLTHGIVVASQLTRTIMQWFMDQLFVDRDRDLQHEYASPLRREDLSGIAPATIINAQHDPLCDHGTLYAQKLRSQGVPVVHTIYGKALHGFFGSQLGESDEAMAEGATALRFAFGLH